MRHYCEQPDLPLHAFRRALGKNRPTTLEGKGGGAPSAPNPEVVGAQTTKTNEETAAFNKALNLNNFNNPFGSQESYISGYDPATGAPIYQTRTLADPALASNLYGLLNQTGQSGGINSSALSGLYGLGSQLGALGNTLSPDAAQRAQQQGQNAAYSAQTQYLDPRFSQQQTSLESQLANQGLTPGSQAYDNAMKNFNLSKNQAYSDAANQSVLTGSQLGTQMLQNQIAGIDTKANLLNQQASLYGQQVGIGQTPYSNLGTIASMVPGYTGPGQSGAQPADMGSYYNNQYQGQLAGYNARTASQNSTTSGLFGLGTAALLAFSDRRVKTDIVPIGKLKDGVNFYAYRYVWDAPGTERSGVMADEVRKVQPEAVVRHPSGFDMVNYGRVFEGH